MKRAGLLFIISLIGYCQLPGQQLKTDSFSKNPSNRYISQPATDNKTQLQQQLLLARQKQLELARQEQQKLLLEKQKKELAEKEKQLLELRVQKKQNELELDRKTQAQALQRNQLEARIKEAVKNKQINTQQAEIENNKKWNFFFTVFILIVAGFAVIAYRIQRKTQRLNAVISQQHDELAQMGMVKDTILGVVSHDMRAPVNTLLAFTELIKEGAVTTEKIGLYLDQINHTLNHTSSVMNNLLNWAASQMQGFKTVIARVDAYFITDGIMHSFAERILAKKIKFTNEIKPGTIVMADANMMELVIRNLVSNALKYTNVNGYITVSEDNKENSIVISVTDNGVGMSEGKMNRFNSASMVQAESTAGTAKEKGTGLGLLLCKTFTRLMNGKITVQTNPEGQGCRFELVLPKG